MAHEEKKNEKEYSPEYLSQVQQFKKRIRYEYLKLCRSRKMKKAQEAKVKYGKCFILTHFRPIFQIWINQVVGFYQQNVWKTPLEEWHFK